VNTPSSHISARGWIFYDAQCRLCRAGVTGLGRLFAQRGFIWLPLQTPGAANRLGLSDADILREMKLQLPGGRVLGGIDAWIHLFRSVLWLWPIGVLLSLPGFHALGQGCYRWLARNRYCLSGTCQVQDRQPHRRTIPFLELP
jgi:predicted DCC family thiol-disulfide oxidoreductase YuxK